MKIFQVDVFTDTPFKGNPAGVCLLKEAQPESWMQNVATEMNLSETAFLMKIQGGFNLRWFTPHTEVPLCGHATLASAHILWEEGMVGRVEPTTFWTKSGKLVCTRTDGWTEMGLPLRMTRTVEASKGLLKALRADREVLSVNAYLSSEERMYMVEVSSAKVLKELNPDFSRLRREEATAVIVTARSSQENLDFVSRFFAPSLGIDEDPVTGSAHCYLTPYWAQKLGKNELVGYQASRRGGIVKCELHEDKVLVKGKAVTVLKGDLVNC